MVKKLVLIDKIYNLTSKERRSNIYPKFLKYLNKKIEGFPNTKIKIIKLRAYDSRFEIEVSGPEEIFVYNLLKKEIGIIHSFENLSLGDIYKAIMVDVGKVGFGIFVDCGIVNPKTDVLVTLYTIRNQLCKGKKVSLSEVIKKYNFINNFPVYVKIEKVDKEKAQIEGIFAKNTINFYEKLITENIDAVFVSGETKEQVKKDLIKTDHMRDIVSIKSFGFLENIILLKEGTDAPGIIAEIGNYLKNCKLSAIRPINIKKLIDN
ncbi:MAG: DUF2110 family protein [Candidatus Hermodarchaeota archaeon]